VIPHLFPWLSVSVGPTAVMVEAVALPGRVKVIEFAGIVTD
jgi:hypothetical protein